MGKLYLYLYSDKIQTAWWPLWNWKFTNSYAYILKRGVILKIGSTGVHIVLCTVTLLLNIKYVAVESIPQTNLHPTLRWNLLRPRHDAARRASRRSICDKRFNDALLNDFVDFATCHIVID